jgi:hypothetical protein
MIQGPNKEQNQDQEQDQVTNNSMSSSTSSLSLNIIDKIILTDDEFENIDAISNLESGTGSNAEETESNQFFFQTIRNDYQHEEPNHISLFTEELGMDTEYKSNQNGTKNGTETTTETRDSTSFAKLGIMDSNRSESEPEPELEFKSEPKPGSDTRMEPHIDTESNIQIVELPIELGTPEIVEFPVELRTTISQNTSLSGNNNTQGYRLRRTGKTSSRTYTAESREPMQGSMQGQRQRQEQRPKDRNTKDMEECGRNCCWCTMWIPALFRPYPLYPKGNTRS